MQKGVGEGNTRTHTHKLTRKKNGKTKIREKIREKRRRVVACKTLDGGGRARKDTCAHKNIVTPPLKAHV